MNLKTKNIFISGDVEFYEHYFPYQNFDKNHKVLQQFFVPTSNDGCLSHSTSSKGTYDLPSGNPLPHLPKTDVNSTSSIDIPRRSSRSVHKPNYLQDFVCDNNNTEH